MQKISRIYLAGCGYRTAWHEGNTIPLTDPVTGAPTDTILQLENGGGKTTLLALLFSCYETEQHKFLKYLQSKNHRFSEYFDQNGAPGYIVVEWLMPPRTAGGQPYRLVVGQAVSVRNTTVPADVERLFFSFTEQADLGLESLPTPNLATPGVGSLQEFSRWVHEQGRRHPDVFTTRNQEEWKRHLAGERLLDLEMLRMQVSFSAQEGGFDAFVSFKTEGEFLKKFYSLTLDQSKAEEARRLVVQVCEKHARKPEFQRRLAELTKFRGSLNAFTEAARTFLSSQAEEHRLVLEGALLSGALQARAAQLKAEFEVESALEDTQRRIAEAASREADGLARQVATVSHVWHQKQVERARVAKEDADKAVTRLEQKERHVKAARLHRAIDASQRQVEELEALAERARQYLEGPREHAETQGAVLHRALELEEQRVDAVLKELAERAKNRSSQEKAQAEAQATSARDEATLGKEEIRLKDAEARRTQRLQALVREGLLASEAEDVLDAIEQWQAKAVGYACERDGLLAQRKTAKAAAVDKRADASRERARAGEYKAEAARLQTYLAAGEAERERLSQLPALLDAVESDIADPFSPLVPQLLANALTSCATQLGTVDVRLAELELTKQAIETTKVAGYSPEVAQVVQVLRDAGVRSARPFNEYIAEAIPDAERARALTVSDPGRFAGVCVARGEFDKAAAVSFDGRRPRKPVMVSVTALEPVAMPGERTVVPADSDAAFNVQAASELAMEIEAKVKFDNERRADLRMRQQRISAATRDVEAFGNAYGDGKLAQAAAQEQAAREDAAASFARADTLEAEAREADERAEDLEAGSKTADEHHREARTAVGRLQEFSTEHEVGRAQRLHRLGELPALVLDAQERQASAKAALEDLRNEYESDFEKTTQARQYAAHLGQERGQLKYVNPDYFADSDLERTPRTLDELRLSYRSAEEHYLTNERDRLGSLSVRIQAETDRKKEKTAEFNRDFHGVTVEQFRPYLRLNHEEVLAENAMELSAARKAQVEAGTMLGTVSQTANSFASRNKELIDVASQAAWTQEPEELEVIQARLETEMAAAQTRMADAAAEANKARDRARAKKESYESDQTADRTARSALDLGEKADVPLILARQMAETGVQVDMSTLTQPVLSAIAIDQVNSLLSRLADKRKITKKHGDSARTSFESVRGAAGSKGFVEADADVAQQMQQNGFADTCRDAERLLEHLDDRIQTTEATLTNMQADFDACIEEVSEVLRIATQTLTRACSPEKCVPAGAPYIGGKQVLKMRADFSRINMEARRLVMRSYLDGLAESKLIPARGTDMIADVVARVHGKPLGLQVLKMSIEESEQYVHVEKISNSGGEGVVMAMFLYLVINQLRAENYADVQKSAGGPLILDNPFAKATSAAMWRAQLLLAKEMNVQLIFATAIHDYNALGEFQRFVRLRKLQNSKTRRWHLEPANFTFTPAQPAEAVEDTEAAV